MHVLFRRDLHPLQAEAPAGRWMMEFIALVVFHSTHESIGDADGQIEVREGACCPLRIEKCEDIGMIDRQDPHIGSTPFATELDVLRCTIKDLQEGKWS